MEKEFVDLETLSAESFKPLKDSAFLIKSDKAPTLELKLLSIDVPKRQDPERGESFSLIFLGPKHILLEQSIYPLEHEKLGVLPIFLVPISKDEEGYSYEAVFTRLKKKGEKGS